MADHRYLKLIQEDTYYGLLVPLTIPVTIAAVCDALKSMIYLMCDAMCPE